LEIATQKKDWVYYCEPQHNYEKQLSREEYGSRTNIREERTKLN